MNLKAWHWILVFYIALTIQASLKGKENAIIKEFFCWLVVRKISEFDILLNFAQLGERLHISSF